MTDEFRPLKREDCSDEGYVHVIDDVRLAVMGYDNKLSDLSSLKYAKGHDEEAVLIEGCRRMLRGWFPVFFEEEVDTLVCNHCGNDSREDIWIHGRTLNPDGTENKAKCEVFSDE